MKKVISVLLLLAMVVGCFAGCKPEVKEDAALNSAKEYLYAMYKDAEAVTSNDYTVVGQVRINDVTYPITWTTDKADNVQIVAGENNMVTVKITAAAEDVNYKLTATLKNADGQEVSVSFDHTIPAKAQVSGKTIVLAYPKENKFVTGIGSVYTSSSGSTKDQLELTENEAEAVALQIVENSDNTISFVAGEYYLYADGTHAKFVKEQGENTKFVLEAADTDGGYFVKCAYATYSGKAQYLEVYSNKLTSYGMGSDPSIYVFKLQESTIAAGTVSAPEETPAPDGGNTSGGNTSGGNTSGGNTSGGNTSGGNTSGGNTSGGNTSGGNTPASGSKVVFGYPKENKFVTGKHYSYTSSSGKTKMELELSESKAEALAMEMIKNSDNTVTFKAGGQYLFCDANNVKFVSSQDDNTKFVLETANGGYYIKCAVANYNGNPQYLEVYGGYLTCYGMGSDTSIYVFTLEDASGANGSISAQDGSNAGSSSSGSSNSGSSNSGSSNSGSSNSGSTGSTDSGSSSKPVGTSVTFDFTSLDKKGVEITEGAFELFDGAASAGGLTAVALTKVYNGNGTGGQFENTAGLLKLGTSKVNGQMALTFSKKVAKVEILCHGWKTGTDNISINGSAEQQLANTGTASTLTFNLDGSSETITIDVAQRAFIFKIIVTFA